MKVRKPQDSLTQSFTAVNIIVKDIAISNEVLRLIASAAGVAFNVMEFKMPRV